MKRLWNELKQDLKRDVKQLDDHRSAKEEGSSEFIRLGGKIEGVKHSIERMREIESVYPQPMVITLCGSTRFQKEYEEVNERLTLAGHIVISCGVFAHSKGLEVTEQQKELLDEIHLRKIDMADEIFVVNVGGYIGASTKREIEYATENGKPVKYYE